MIAIIIKLITSEMPILSASDVSVKDSVYAGGDYGGESVNYDTITVTGFSPYLY